MYWEPIDVSATESLPDEATLTADAATIKTKINTFKAHIVDMESAWKGLSGIYEAPAQQQVLAAMNDPKNAAEDLVDSGTSVKKALQDFASTVGDLETKHITLVSDISDAKALYAGSASYSDSPGGSVMGDGMVGHRKHTALATRAKSLASDYTTAQEKCVAVLKAIGRVTTDVTSHYAPGILDLVSNDSGRLRRDTSKQNSSVAQIRAYYAYLGKMTPKQIKAFGEDYPEAAVYGPRKSMPAREQVEFWNGLSPAQQTAMAASLPIIVGNTEGVTYGKRSKANREVLRLVTEKDFTATKEQKKAFTSIKESLKAPYDAAGDRYLISFDPSTNKALAGVAIGNLDEATTITLNASGISSNTQSMLSETKKAQALFLEQGKYGAPSTNAVVAWIGYDSPGIFPDSTEVNYTDKAKVGGKELATQLDGLHLTRQLDGNDPPRVNVGAHSYGTTMATYALTQTEFDVDSVYFYGSAGVDPNVASTAEDLHVKRGDDGRREVYATQAFGDLIAPGGIQTSQFGDIERISPTDDAFGAKVLNSEASVDIEGRPLRPTTGHNGIGTHETQGLAGPEPGELKDYLRALENGDADLIGLKETEKGQGYLDADTTSMNHYGLVSLGKVDALAVTDQSFTDDYVEAKEKEVNDLFAAPGAYVDEKQHDVNAFVDDGQSKLDDLGSKFVGKLNSAVDGGQDLISGVTDRGQSVVSDLVNGSIDRAQEQTLFGRVFRGPIDSVQEIASDTFNGVIDDKQEIFNFKVDGIQAYGNNVDDGFGHLQNLVIDGAQESANDKVDEVQRSAGKVGDAFKHRAEDAIRAHSLANRDLPTR